jgi:hypothetical protein
MLLSLWLVHFILVTLSRCLVHSMSHVLSGSMVHFDLMVLSLCLVRSEILSYPHCGSIVLFDAVMLSSSLCIDDSVSTL